MNDGIEAGDFLGGDVEQFAGLGGQLGIRLAGQRAAQQLQVDRIIPIK